MAVCPVCLTIIILVAFPMLCLFLLCYFGCCQSEESLEEKTLSDLHERMKRRRNDPTISNSESKADTFNNRRAKGKIRRKRQVSDCQISKETFNDRRDLKILSKLYFQKLPKDTIGFDPRIFRETKKECERVENILKGNFEEAEKALDVERGSGLKNQSLSHCDSSNFECPICLNEYIPGDVVCIAKKPVCDHMYHLECIVERLQKQSCCPLCRSDLMH